MKTDIRLARPARFLPALAVCLGTMPALPAAARLYVEANGGFPSNDPATLFDDDSAGTDFEFDLDTNSAFSVAIGTDSWFTRSELELTFRDTEGVLLNTDPPSADAGSGSFDNISLMSNLYLDVPVGLGFELFAGGGVGAVMFDGDASGSGSLDTADFDDAGYGFAYQLRAGVLYNVTPNVGLSAGYRYWRSGEIDFDEFELDNVEVHSVDLGLRITF
jgi:opacity protein-like surface antigen